MQHIFGISFKQSASIISIFLKKRSCVDVGSIGNSSDTIENYSKNCLETVTNILNVKIDRKMSYSLMLDQTDNEYTHCGVCMSYIKIKLADCCCWNVKYSINLWTMIWLCH